jgi:hypothetical protein
MRKFDRHAPIFFNASPDTITAPPCEIDPQNPKNKLFITYRTCLASVHESLNKIHRRGLAIEGVERQMVLERCLELKRVISDIQEGMKGLIQHSWHHRMIDCGLFNQYHGRLL